MKRIFLLFIPAAILFSCKKQGTDNGNSPSGETDYTPTPPVETVNTSIAGYSTNDAGQTMTSANLLQVTTASGSTLPVAMQNGYLSSSTFAADKSMTRFYLYSSNPGWAPTFKSVPVSGAIKNYVRLTIASGSVKNSTGGSVSVAATGSINYGINSFYVLPQGSSLGYFGPELVTTVFTTYYNPEDKEFALNLPCYLAADDNGKRWFLRSYGGISFAMSSNGLYNENMDMFAGNRATVKLPIPATMQATAPDTVAAWQLVNGLWKKNGQAIKQNNFYAASIGTAGTWNFAVPVKGVYLTVKLRTDSNATITNTAVRIKSAARVIAESQTDADGNATCFVPSNESLSAEIIPDYRTDIRNSSFTFPVNALTKAGDITLKLPETTTDLSTIFGNVLNCNNQPVSSGTVKILMSDNRDYYVPFTNGKFATAVWISGMNVGVNNTKVQVTDDAGNQGIITNLSLARKKIQFPNFYTCTNATGLYCNFSIDNVKYEFKDDASLATPYLKLTRPAPVSPAYDLMRMTNASNMGVNFAVYNYFANPGIWYMGPMADISVNGKPCAFDPGLPGNTNEATLSFSRYDAAANGIVEGYFAFYYFDNATPAVSHFIKGNFKIKKNF